MSTIILMPKPGTILAEGSTHRFGDFELSPLSANLPEAGSDFAAFVRIDAMAGDTIGAEMAVDVWLNGTRYQARGVFSTLAVATLTWGVSWSTKQGMKRETRTGSA